MRKLTLESLEVTSFVTETPQPDERGTVLGHADTKKACSGYGCESFQCPTSPELDCTYGCTQAMCLTNACDTEFDC